MLYIKYLTIKLCMFSKNTHIFQKKYWIERSTGMKFLLCRRSFYDIKHNDRFRIKKRYFFWGLGFYS